MFRKTKGQAPRQNSGQSTVEYILVVTAVIAVMIFFLTSNNAGLRGKLNSTVDTAANNIGNMSDRLDRSHAASNGQSVGPQITFDPTIGFPQ